MIMSKHGGFVCLLTCWELRRGQDMAAAQKQYEIGFNAQRTCLGGGC